MYGIHHDGRDAQGPVGDPAAKSSCSSCELEPGVDRQAQVDPGDARATAPRRAGNRIAVRVGDGQVDLRLPGQLLLVALLDAVLALALAVDEAEQLGGQRRVGRPPACG